MSPLESRQSVSHKDFNSSAIVAESRGNGLWGLVEKWAQSILGVHSCWLTTIFTKEMERVRHFCLDHPEDRPTTADFSAFRFSPLCRPCSPTQTPGRWGPSPRSPWHSCAGPWRGQSAVASPASWGMFGSGLCPFHLWSWVGVCGWQKCRRDPFHWPRAAEPGFPSGWRAHRPGKEREENLSSWHQ